MKNNKIIIFLGLFNVVILVFYLMNYDITSSIPFFICIFFTLTSITALLNIKLKFRVFDYLNNLQISIFTLILFFILCEISFIIEPNLMPLQIRVFLATDDVIRSRRTMVEYIDENPFVKFKPNTIVRSQGNRGSENDFCYEWKTDKFGFKNPNDLVEREKADIIAIGDSFTEGMGVCLDKTWSGILTKKGFDTINLGVQGYSMSQIKATLQIYGLKFSPKILILGYTSRTYGREATDPNIRKKHFAGGEVEPHAKYFVSAFYEVLKREMKYAINRYFVRDKCESVFSKYQNEIAQIEQNIDLISNVELGTGGWKETVSRILEVHAIAKKERIKMILIYFPHRGEVYFEKCMKRKLPQTYFAKIESQELRKICKKYNILFLDTTTALIDYVNSLKHNEKINKYPYLEFDGHMSDIGHRLVAEKIVQFLDKHEAVLNDDAKI